MKLFGPLHLALLAAIAILAAALAAGCRRGWIPRRAARFTIAGAVGVNELVWWIWRYSREGIHASNLPLQLCDVLVWLSALACLTAIPAVVEVAYFAGIAGAGMALLTPDLFAPWPSYPDIYFFVAHGGIVIAVVTMAFGGFVQFRPGAVWRSFGWLLGYAVVAGSVDAAFGSNYMYLRAKPRVDSLLNDFGPWPWYLLVSALIAKALFWVLWLPVRSRSNEQAKIG